MAQGLTPEQQRVFTDRIETARMSISESFREALDGMQKAIDDYAAKQALANADPSKEDK